MRSSLVYKFCCTRCSSVSYIGSTKRCLYSRVDQHAGRSFRTGLPLTNPDQSAVRNHSEECGTDFNLDNFKVLLNVSNVTDLRLA